MSEDEGRALADGDAKAEHSFGGKALIVILLVVGVAVVVPMFRGPELHEVRGTITNIDLTARRATLRYVDPATGTVREVTGDVPESCGITVNGKPAELSDLTVGDVAKAQALIEDRERDGKKEKCIVAEELHVDRAERGDP